MELAAVSVFEIPASALTRSNQQASVWIVDPKKNTVAMRNVDVVRFDQNKVSVGYGLEDGDIIVTAGVQALHPGQQVRLLGMSPRTNP
jgi:multidrug efflux pump subunit AcrA (membrane-fusion protein)